MGTLGSGTRKRSTLTRPVALLKAALEQQNPNYLHGLWLIACSGGRDSLCLAQAAFELGLKRVCLCSIDHGLQPMAEAQVQAVKSFAESHGFEMRAYRADRQKIDAGLGIEDGARKERYRLLKQCAAEIGAQFVLTAHHADDQAETVLMRLADGAGLKGLCGIPPVRKGKNCSFLRPWLALTRAEIEQYAASRAVKFVEDPTNASTDYRRNRLRLLLPDLSVATHQQFARQAASSAALCLEAFACLDYLAKPLQKAALQPAVRQRNGLIQKGFLIDPRWLQALPQPLIKWLLSQALDRLQARGRGRKNDLERIWAFWPCGEGRLMLPPGIEVSRAGRSLWLGRMDGVVDDGAEFC